MKKILKDSKFKFGDHIRISKYKNIFSKSSASDWSEEVFEIGKVKNTVPWNCWNILQQRTAKDKPRRI